VSKNVKLLSPSDLKLLPKRQQIKLAYQLDEIKARCPYLNADVKLTLEGERKNNEAAWLNWKAVNATYSKQYVIERSLGDSLHFETVNHVWPDEIASQKEKYELNDNNDFKQLSYYRIKLVLLSGKSVYSNIALVKGYTDDKMMIYPNPARNFIFLNAYNDVQEITGITVMDGAGKIVLQTKQHQIAGLPYRQQLDVSQLTSGTYWLKLAFADRTSRTGKFIKQ
jgi:hypothetical protein